MSDNYFQSSPYGSQNMNMGYSLPLYNPMSPQINRYQQLTQSQFNNNAQSQATQLQPNTNVNWVQVANMQSAKEQIVQPNTTMWMLDASLPQMYVKSVSSVGTIEFKAYKLVDIDSTIKNDVGNQENVEFVPISRFKTLEDDFNSLKLKIATYESLLKDNQNVASNKEETTKPTSRRGGNSNESIK